MADKIDIHRVRVFVDNNRNFGSPVAIVLDEDNHLSPKRRQEITEYVGFSETVFINNLENAEVSVYSHHGQIPFAGAPLLGTAWFIESQLNKQIKIITSMSKQTKVLHDEGLLWIMTEEVSTLPAWDLEQLNSPEEVEGIDASKRPDDDHSYVWAWIDQSLRVAKVRARTFAKGWEITEEEANGSGSMLLAIKTDRSLLIHHGKGSIIRATSGTSGVAIGGLVKRDPTISI